jgi:hypothetical protein
MECSSLTNVTISEGVTTIANSAFYDCNNITTITIPNTVNSIGYSAFEECDNLETITVLGKSTSDAQTLLANAEVPTGCTIIGELG